MKRRAWGVKCSKCGRVFLTKVSRQRRCPFCGEFGWHKQGALTLSAAQERRIRKELP
jgi:uncharacterized OB-fold protein